MCPGRHCGEGSRLRRVASVDTFEECAPARNDTVGRMAQRALLMRGDSAMQVCARCPACAVLSSAWLCSLSILWGSPAMPVCDAALHPLSCSELTV